MQSLLLILAGVLLTLIADRLLPAPGGTGFKLTDLSKITFIMLVIYAVFFFGNEALSFELNTLSFYLFFLLLMAIAPFLILSRSVQYRVVIHSLAFFPKIKKTSFLYFMLLLFFLFISAGTLRAVHTVPIQILGSSENQIILNSVIRAPLSSILLLLIMSPIAITSEEIVFRYFAINSLRERTNKLTAILIPAMIWTLMHWDFSLNRLAVGLFLGYFFYKTKSLSLCVLLHFILNILAYTEIFYIYQRRLVSPWSIQFEYAIFLFLFPIIVYHIVEMTFGRRETVV